MACARHALSLCGYACGCSQSACGMRRCDRTQGTIVRIGWHGALLRRPACRAHGLTSRHPQLGRWRRRAASRDAMARGTTPAVIRPNPRMMPRSGLGHHISTPNAPERSRLRRRGACSIAQRALLLHGANGVPLASGFANLSCGAGRDAAMGSTRLNAPGSSVRKHWRALTRFHPSVEVRGHAGRVAAPRDAGFQIFLACSCPETCCLMLSFDWNFAGYARAAVYSLVAFSCQSGWPPMPAATRWCKRRLQRIAHGHRGARAVQPPWVLRAGDQSAAKACRTAHAERGLDYYLWCVGLLLRFFLERRVRMIAAC